MMKKRKVRRKKERQKASVMRAAHRLIRDSHGEQAEERL